MRKRFKLFCYRLWLRWEVSKLHVREEQVTESRENVRELLAVVTELSEEI